MSRQERIRQQNRNLRQTVQGYIEQIQKLKKVNEQHETQIDTLLKFNERLLIIIQTQLNTYNNHKSQRSYSLQPISQITQKDSDAIQPTIKASITHPLKLHDIQFKDDERSKRSGNQTDRVKLGEHLQDALSYEVSRSDYQKQYSEYSKKQKMKEVVALINAYKKEYGESIRECQQAKMKIKQDAYKQNKQIEIFNNQNNSFYGTKMQQLMDLKQKMKSNSSSNQLQKLINQKKYSAKTQSKLLKIMGSTK